MYKDESKIFVSNNKKIAIIYSLDDLFEYIVKICYRDSTYYVGGNNAERFGNISDAKNACRLHEADEAFLALSNSYQEFDPFYDNLANSLSRYDYQKIDL